MADREAADHYSDGEIIVEGGLAFAESDVLALVYSAPTCKVSQELRGLGYRVMYFAEFASEL